MPLFAPLTLPSNQLGLKCLAPEPIENQVVALSLLFIGQRLRLRQLQGRKLGARIPAICSGKT